jgi:hypothetical protein
MFLVVALGFKLFGPSLMLLKVLSVLTECALALSVFWLARQVAPAGLAALAGLFVCTWMEPYSGIPNPVAVVFALLGSAAFLPALTGRGQPRVFLAGVLLGISLLLRHDVALPVLLSHAVVGSCFWFVRDDLGPLSPGERLRRLGRDGARHAAGVLAAVAGPLVWLLGQVPFRMMYEQLVLIPLTIYPVNRRLPYPWGLPKSGALLETDLFLPRYLPKLSGWFQFIFPFLVVGLACWALLLLGRRREFRRGPAMPWAGLLFVLHAVLLFNQMAIRPDHWHLLPSMTACALLLVFSISVLARLGRPGPVLLLWLMLALVSVAPVAKRLELFRDWWCADRWVSLDTPRSQGIRIMSGVAPQYNSLIQYLREHVPEGRRIYVGNTWHDRILQCDPMTYFLSERHSATREFHMIPGVTTRDDVQRAIILDLERESVEYIVLFADKGWEPNASCRSSGVFTLDRWIRSNFVLVKDYYPWTVWRRSLAPIGLGAR